MAGIDRNALAAALGLSKEDQKVCEVAGSHPYDCRCDTCLAWWRSVGPDPSGGRYGAFTIEEIEGKSHNCLCGQPATRTMLNEPQVEGGEPIPVYYCDKCWVDL